jgi:hypothetical protein
MLVPFQAIMCVCEFIVAIIGLKLESSNLAGQRALISLVCIYIGAFAATWVSAPTRLGRCQCLLTRILFVNMVFFAGSHRMVIFFSSLFSILEG